MIFIILKDWSITCLNLLKDIFPGKAGTRYLVSENKGGNHGNDPGDFPHFFPS